MVQPQENIFFYLLDNEKEFVEHDIVIDRGSTSENLRSVVPLGDNKNKPSNIPISKLAPVTSQWLEEYKLYRQFTISLIKMNNLPLFMGALKNHLIGNSNYYEFGDTIQHMIARNAQKDDLLCSLLDSSEMTDLRNLRNTIYDSILHAAVRSKNVSIFNCVLKRIENMLSIQEDVELPNYDSVTRNRSNAPMKTILVKYVDLTNLEGDTAILLAAKLKFSHAIVELIRIGSDVHFTNKDMNTPLHIAAAANECATIEAMYLALNEFKGHAEWINATSSKNSRKRLPIMVTDNAECMRILLRDVELYESVSDDYGNILCWACGNNNSNLVNEFIKKTPGKKLDIVNNKGFTPLKIACKHGFDDVIDSLLKAKANPNFVGKLTGFTAINTAALYGHLSSIKLLLNSGAQTVISSMINTALHSAVYGGQPKVVKYLLSIVKMDANILNVAKRPPLYQAIKENQVECAKILIEHNADVDMVVDPETGLRPIHLSVKEGHRRILKLLLDNNCNPDITMKGGLTALMLTAEKDRSSYIALLMGYGINLTKKDDAQNTAVHHMAMHGAVNCVKYLMERIEKFSGVTQEYQIYRNLNGEAESPFDIVCREKHEELLEIFIKFAPIRYFDEKALVLHNLNDNNLHQALFSIFNTFTNEDKGVITAQVKVFDLNSQGQYPEERKYKHLLPSLLHKIHNSSNLQLKYHPLVRALVDQKLFIYRGWYIFSFLVYLTFLIFLYFSLFRASYICDDMLWAYDTTTDIVRGFCEIVCIFFWLLYVTDETIEFIIECYQIHYDRHPKKNDEKAIKTEHSRSSLISFIYRCFSFSNTLARIENISYYIPSATINYFSSFNVIDFSSLLFLFIFAIFRIIQSPYQWTFASISLILCTIKLFKYTRIIPALGAYVTSVFRIFVIDIPRFSVIVVIILIAYVGGIHLAARQQVFPSGQAVSYSTGAACMNTNTSILWFDGTNTANYDFLRPIISGFIFLLDGGPGNYESNLFDINLLFTLLYLGFAFTIIVVMSNILIAQLSETYSEVIRTGSQLHYKMDLVVNLELKSNLAFLTGKFLQKFITITHINMPKEKWEKLLETTPQKTIETRIEEIDQKLDEAVYLLSSDSQKNLLDHEWLRENVSNISNSLLRFQFGGPGAGSPPRIRSAPTAETSSPALQAMDRKIDTIRGEMTNLNNKLNEIIRLIQT